MLEEKELETQAEEATTDNTYEITEEAVDAADDYGIFSFLADLPIFAIEKQLFTKAYHFHPFILIILLFPAC